MRHSMRWAWLPLFFGTVGSACLLSPGLQAQCIDISTGYDQDGAIVIDPGLEDDDYTVDLADGSLGSPPAYVVEEDGFPIGPWFANSDKSKWIGFNVSDSNSIPGTYFYEIHVFLAAAIDASKAVMIGKWATDDGSPGFEINGTLVASPSDGFGVLKSFPPNSGLGLFVTGENVIRFQVDNGGTEANPTGLRVEGCVGVPVAVNREFDLSTGFDEGNHVLFGDAVADDDYRVTGPPGSGLTGATTLCVTDDGFPIPPWVANSVNSRWIGVDGGDSSSVAGDFLYRVAVFLPASFTDPARAVLRGGMAGDDSVTDILVNGMSTGIVTSADFTELSPLPVDAGQGLFKNGANTVDFIVSNGAEGSTAFRFDGEVILGPEIPAPATSVLLLDTGFDDAAGAVGGNGAQDDNYVIIGPPGSDVGPSLATIGDDTIFPIAPNGPWIGTSALSKWIAPQADTNGPGGLYRYRIHLEIPADRDAAMARIVGIWAVDDSGVDVVINGVSTGIGNGGGFGTGTAFPPGAGQGLFQTGVNVVEFVISNGGGPTGLRVEAVVGFEDPRTDDLATGISPRGIGPLSAGEADTRYHVSGPEGSGIVDEPSVVVAADGNPIPPWAANSTQSQWVGLNGGDSVGPAGRYTYRTEFNVGPGLNPQRLALQGSWTAAGSGVDVILNGTPLGVAAASPNALVAFPPKAGLGSFIQGLNTLEFLVENPSGSSTGLRVEATFASVAEANPFDISTGFDQASGTVMNDGDQDADYELTDPILGADLAFVAIGAPIPPWIASTNTSKWVGANSPGALSPPGQYLFEVFVDIPTDEQAADATLSGGWSVDDHGDDVVINGVSTGLQNDGGFVNLTLFPTEFGLGLFQKGLNSIQFIVTNGGITDNPMGLRVDAVVVLSGTQPPPETFHRGDADENGELQLTDAIRILGVLFLGQGTISCQDAADADDNGSIQLTDAIRILGVLFLGQGVIPAPGPTSSPCGVDPTADALGCESYSPCTQ